MTKRHTKLAITLAALAAVVIAAVLLPLGEWALRLVEYVRGTGPLGIGLYAAVYIVATVLLIPGSMLSIGAGFIWGVGGGFLLVWPASTAGACLAFLLGRYLARGWVADRMRGSPRLKAIDDAVGEDGFTIVALLRLSPLVPFTLLNYVLGLSRTRLSAYGAATALAMTPGILLYVYIGSLVTDAAALASGERPDAGGWERVFFWGGLAATAAATVLISRLARRKLRRETSLPA